MSPDDPIGEEITEVKGKIKEIDRLRGQLTQRKNRLLNELQGLVQKQKEMLRDDDDADV